MFNMLLAAIAATSFTYYPQFVQPDSKITTVTDLGPVLEVVVKCHRGSAIMSYSKIERVFCTPDWVCYRDMQTAASKACN